MKRYTGAPNKDYYLASLDAQILAELAMQIQGAEKAIVGAAGSIDTAREAINFLSRFSSSSSLEEALSVSVFLQDLLDRVAAAAQSPG